MHQLEPRPIGTDQLVRGVQPFRHRDRDAQRDFEWQRVHGVVAEQRRHRNALHEFHDREGTVGVLPDIDDADHVRVPNQSRDPYLIHEHRAHFRLTREIDARPLDREEPFELALTTHRQVDATHATHGKRQEGAIRRVGRKFGGSRHAPSILCLCPRLAKG
jgi:hypothetical protein